MAGVLERATPEISRPKRFSRELKETPLAPALVDVAVSRSDANLDAAMVWQDEPPRRASAFSAALHAILGGMASAAGAIGRAASWLTMDGHAVVRWIERRIKRWFGAHDGTLDQLAEKARHSILGNRFRAASAFSADEWAMIESVDLSQRRIHQAGCELCVEGEACPNPMYIVSGWAARVRVLANGRQQVVGLLLPGDGVCLHRDVEPRAPSTVTAITMVETVDATRLLRMAHAPEKYPGLARAVERAAALQETFSDNHIMRLGALTKVERAGHLMFELRWRLAEAGLADQRQFPLPLTHEALADLLGMSASQVRKAMRRLRAFRILSVRYGRAMLLEQGRRGKFAGFRPPGATIIRRAQPAPLASV
jgi:CRP-like cAMP-binding protein